MEPVGFEGVVGFIANNKALATRYLAEYFDRSEPDGGFTGRWFEHFSALSDELHLDANDVAAAATLSVPLDGSTVRSLFERAEELNGFLAAAPSRDAKLWDVDEADLADGAPLAKAYDLLRNTPGIGYVTASKLLACKRPHLVPIRDTVVEQLLGAGTAWWLPWRRLVSDQSLRDLVNEVTPRSVPAATSLLRCIDVILWRAGKSI
jgi:hypothetical protein